MKNKRNPPPPYFILPSNQPGIYTTADHWLEVECMRQLYEPLFRVYSVDLVFNGHTHDYERGEIERGR